MALSENLVIEKNKLNAQYPWLILLDFKLNDPENQIFRFVRNHPNVTFQGNVYNGFNFDLGLIEQSIDGKIHDTMLSVSGVTYALQKDLEELDGATDAEIILTVVHADNLDEDYSELELFFDVLSTHIGQLSIDFTIGAPSPLLQRLLTERYFADFCSYREFGGPRCKYVGEAEFCNRRLADCRELENSPRFGGCPGLRVDGVRFL